MGLTSSLYTGVSGLETNSVDLSVIGDNIANANTVGFKSNRASFEEALSQTIIGGSAQGYGSKLQAIQRLVTQGALTSTGLATDLAIQGSGLFVVRGSNNGLDGTFYTRAGQFTVDKDGYLSTLEGLKVQGYAADTRGVVGGPVTDLRIGDASSPPEATTAVTLKANLQASAPIPGAFDIADPTTWNFTSTMQIYDSLGHAHSVALYFRHDAAGSWEWHGFTDGAGLTGGTPGTLTEIASGTLTFDTSGNLTAEAQTSAFNPIDAVNPQPLTFDFGNPTTGVVGVTQYDSPSATTFISQDGASAGALARFAIDGSGVITGTFSNGQTRSLGQVVVADFAAPDQLERQGSNLFGRVPAAGDPTIGVAGSGGRGAIAAGALEQSNVDLATEFVRMITAQRGFQANSKTIMTADQLLSELINIKR